MTDLTPGVGKYDAEIRLLWPGRLERCEHSKQRQTVRKAYKRYVKFKALEASGATCRTCFSYEDPNKDRSDCEIECDWQTTCTVEADNLCLKWGPRPESTNG